MGVRNGKPFIKELGKFKGAPEAEKKLEPLLGKKLKNIYGENFKIILLPGRAIYKIIYENDPYLNFSGPREIINTLLKYNIIP